MTLSLDATWHLKPHSRTTFGNLELETRVVMIAAPEQFFFAKIHHNKNTDEEPKSECGLTFLRLPPTLGFAHHKIWQYKEKVIPTPKSEA